MSLINHLLNKFGYNFHLTRTRGDTIHYKGPNPDFYGIGVAHGAEVGEDGIPAKHTQYRIYALEELRFDGYIHRQLISGNRKESRDMLEWAVKWGIPREDLYLEENSATMFIGMHNVKKLVDEWKNNGEIPPNPTIYWIIQRWAAQRAHIIADCVFKDYEHVIYDVHDGRDESIVSLDASKEPKNLKIDSLACKLYNLTKDPTISQVIASLVMDPLNIPKHVKERI